MHQTTCAVSRSARRILSSRRLIRSRIRTRIVPPVLRLCTPWISFAGGLQQSKTPALIFKAGVFFWRRPTLAQPIAVLPSGLQRFTAVFGMGTGGATALVSPEIYAVLVGTNFWCVIRDSRFETRGSESFRRITIHDSRISIHQRFTVHSVKELPIL